MTNVDFSTRLQPAPLSARFEDPDYYVWCGTAVKGDDGLYHLFYSRWPRRHGFKAWLTHSEIAHAVAPGPFGPYRHKGVALPARGADYWDGLNTHNPTIRKFGAHYYLYYTGTTGDGAPAAVGGGYSLNWTHRNNQRIGVAMASDLNGPWKRFDEPLIAPTAGFHDALCCANPSVTDRLGGGYLMVYKTVADKKPLPFGGPVLHCVAVSDSPTGPFVKQPDPVFVKDGVHFAAEDPFVWTEGGGYHAIVKDMNGYFTGCGRSLALFESVDGLDWKLAAHPLVSRTEIFWEDGRQENLQALERPQLLLEDGRPLALICAAGEHGHETGPEKTFNVQIPLGDADRSEKR